MFYEVGDGSGHKKAGFKHSPFNALVVPRDAVSSENGQSVVRVKNGFGFESRKVELGAMSDFEVVIQSGIEPGAVVLRHIQAQEGRAS